MEARRQVDDFNTVDDSSSPQAESGGQRPDSAAARSDPGVLGGDNDKVETAPTTSGHEGGPHSPAPPPPPPPAEAEQEAAEEAAATALDYEAEAAPARSRLANTPTTPFTDFSRRLGPSRPSQQTAASVRQQRLYYEHAVNLVAARCASDPRSIEWLHRHSADGGDADPPPGFGAPRFFYVRQQRPRPMTPLKAWAGYHGNVYFSPMRIERASYSDPDELLALPSLPACSSRLQRVLEPSRLNADRLMQLRARAAAGPRQPRRAVRRLADASGGGAGQRPVVQLDRAYLASRGSRKGTSMSDSRDVHLYRSAHATGTLQFLQEPQPQQQQQQQQQHYQSAGGRVHRGCVSRKLRHLREALAQPQPQAQPQQPQAQGQPGKLNTSMVSLDREMDRLYDKMPSLMASVPRPPRAAQQRGGAR